MKKSNLLTTAAAVMLLTAAPVWAQTCIKTPSCADLGYTNPTSFRRAFKKYYGMTPSEMRDQPKKQEEKSE